MNDDRDIDKRNLSADPWLSLKQFTAARIGLGRIGTSVPLKESLNFKFAHAHARDAVFASLKKEALTSALEVAGHVVWHVHSQVTSRQSYLMRPDLGRQLDDASREFLLKQQAKPSDVVVILADGLSALAINSHSVPVVTLLQQRLKLLGILSGPIVLAEQGRVAIGDEIGSLLKARMAVILIGERPGLSSPDSLGAYLTYNPRAGLSDEARNCVSNIRPQGLSYTDAVTKISWLITESLTRRISGVGLKEDSPDATQLR